MQYRSSCDRLHDSNPDKTGLRCTRPTAAPSGARLPGASVAEISRLPHRRRTGNEVAAAASGCCLAGAEAKPAAPLRLTWPAVRETARAGVEDGARRRAFASRDRKCEQGGDVHSAVARRLTKLIKPIYCSLWDWDSSGRFLSGLTYANNPADVGGVCAQVAFSAYASVPCHPDLGLRKTIGPCTGAGPPA